MYGMGEDGQLGFEDILEEPDEEEAKEEEERVRLGGEEYDPYGDVEEISIRIPRKLAIQNGITHISAGSLTTVAINSIGQVYAWGCTHGHCLGVDPGPGFINSPRLLKNVDGLDYHNNHYISAYAGSSYTLLLSCQGNVFATGFFREMNGKEYKVCIQPGEAMTGHNNKFTKMDCFGGEVQQIHGGEQHAAVLKYDGSLYTWGICDTPGIGYLGREVIGHEFRDEETGLINTKVLKDNLTPKEVQWKGESLPILTMSCGMYHMLLITTQRKLYSVGLNKDGQLGLGDTTNRSEFEMVDTLKNYNMLHVGVGSYHSVCTDVDGRIFTFGRGDGGRLGLPELKDPSITGAYCIKPAQVLLPDQEIAVNLSCGDNNSLVTTDKGNLYLWGYDIEGDLGLPRKVKFDDHVFVKNVSAGSQHTVVLATATSVNDD